VPYPLSNILLDSMPEIERRKLSRHLKPMTLPVGTSLYEPDDPPRYIHFLTSGIASIVMTMEKGTTIEVGTVGREGAPQGTHLMGPIPVLTRCFMQVAGTGLRMDYQVFENIFVEEEVVRKPMLAYAQYQTVLLGLVAGCNRLHPVEARLARWLVMVQDRTGDTVLKLTQEFLSQMIGSQRTTVSAVAGSLQERGLIRYARGQVNVLDRTGLEHAACECYASTRRILSALYALAGQRPVEDLS
jgi:CRP-like cAMP-binding protein